jgi:hypothetical protein
MYEPKAKDFLTSNGKHILVYDYLDFPYTVMLASEIVIGINPELDEITYLIPDKEGVYVDITTSQCLKPTYGTVDINSQIGNLLKYSLNKPDSKTDYWLDRKENYHTLTTHFIKQN